MLSIIKILHIYTARFDQETQSLIKRLESQLLETNSATNKNESLLSKFEVNEIRSCRKFFSSVNNIMKRKPGESIYSGFIDGFLKSCIQNDDLVSAKDCLLLCNFDSMISNFIFAK